MTRIEYREVSDELWSKVEPLVPMVERPVGRRYLRQSGGGRKPMLPREVFSAIVYVLRTRCNWKELPKAYGRASTVHRHFLQWERKGFFHALWNAGLAEEEELEGIRWEWRNNYFGNPPEDERELEAAKRSTNRRVWLPAVSRRQREEQS